MNDLDARLDAYLTGYRERYPREALTRGLLEAGYDPESIEGAWARVGEGARVVPSGSSRASTRSGRGTLVVKAIAGLIALGAYGSSIAIAVFLAMYATAGSQTNFSQTDFLLLLGVGAYVIAMLGGLAYSIYGLARAPSRDGGATAIFVAIVVSVAYFLALNGIVAVGIQIIDLSAS